MTVDDKHSGGLSELYLAERIPMVRLATLLLGSAHQAEEIVQDAFMTVGDRWDMIDRPGGYLRTTVVNGCRAKLRRREVEGRHLEASTMGGLDEAVLPSHLVELHDALRRLNERQRTVIVLRYFVDIPDPEIAQIMQISPVTVRTLTHRSLSILREELS